MVDTGLSLPHDRAPPTAIHVSLHTGRGPAMMTAARSAGEPRPQSAGPVGALRLAPPQGGRGVWTDVRTTCDGATSDDTGLWRSIMCAVMRAGSGAVEPVAGEDSRLGVASNLPAQQLRGPPRGARPRAVVEGAGRGWSR